MPGAVTSSAKVPVQTGRHDMGMNRSVLTCALGFVLACGGEATPTDQTPLGLKDVRVAIPAADPSIIDLVTPEV